MHCFIIRIWFFSFIFLSFSSFFSLDRCSIPSREVSILWSYLDIILLFSSYVYLIFSYFSFITFICFFVLCFFTVVNFLLMSTSLSFLFQSLLSLFSAFPFLSLQVFILWFGKAVDS